MIDNKEQALVILSEIIGFYKDGHKNNEYEQSESEALIKRANEIEKYIGDNLK